MDRKKSIKLLNHAVADELQIADDAVVRALENFEGIDRRFQSLGEVQTDAGKVTLIADYGHHPTEVAATLAAAKNQSQNKTEINNDGFST